MRAFSVLAVLCLGAAVGAQAQLAVSQPTEKLLVLQLSAAPMDSASSIQTMDEARARLVRMARYKALVVPKDKICEALTQSGFPCDGMMTAIQASQLARALGVNSFTTGDLRREGGQLVAHIRVISGASGFSAAFNLSGATPLALGGAIADRMFNVIKAAENSRNCNEQRGRNQLERALAEARKAFTIEPNLTAAWLCIATVQEVQKAPFDSQIVAYRGALKGDPGNQEAWGRLAQLMLVKGDTVGTMDAYDSLLNYNPGDANLRKSLAQLMLQHKQFERAAGLLKAGIDINPADQQMRDMYKRACIEGGLYQRTLAILKEEAEQDTTKLSDTVQLKLAMANAQAAPDTQALLWWAHEAVAHYPTSPSWLKQLGGAFLTAGRLDSAVFYYRKALAQDPADVATSLLIAKTIVDNAVWDTAAAGKVARDTAALRRLREPFAARVDSARPYLTPGYASRDSAFRLFTINVAYSAATKLAQAGALDRVYQWLEIPFQQLEDDTATGHQPLRSTVGYLYGLASTYTMAPLLTDLGKSKKCDGAPALNQRIQRSKMALNLGARVAPQAVRAPLGTISQFENFMVQVKRSFKCTNF